MRKTWKSVSGSYKKLYNFVTYDVDMYINILHETKRFVLYKTLLNYYLFKQYNSMLKIFSNNSFDVIKIYRYV